MAQTHKSIIFQDGIERGRAVASWIDLPQIGSVVLTESDGRIVITKENQADVWVSLCYDAESNGRQYSPFEFTARELNDLHESKPYDVWEVFESGITEGINREWSEQYAR